MDIVIPRVDISLSYKAMIVHLRMRRAMNSPNLLALGLVINIRVGALPIDKVAMGVMRMFI